MKNLWIIVDSIGRGTCRSCGAAIQWATISGSDRRTPFNPPIILVPQLHLSELAGAPLDVAEVDMLQTSSHFATCPQANQWRTR